MSKASLRKLREERRVDLVPGTLFEFHWLNKVTTMYVLGFESADPRRCVDCLIVLGHATVPDLVPGRIIRGFAGNAYLREHILFYPPEDG